QEDPDLREQFRGATIQAFEYTYGLATKMIHRQLGQIVANPAELREMAFLDLMRTAADAGLIRQAPPFKIYREMRNITSHTYNPERAEEVVSVVDDFLHDIRFLLEELQRRNHEVD
ncbi:MAG: HI0074 family nucleotidyltransferase substrate-binding subunit, partial [Deltaproteobacteria bacterium]|nr:HI0074 family nucleotidyltransferase substrate-binding subunit [Deltaproteobacteria bacterium]